MMIIDYILESRITRVFYFRPHHNSGLLLQTE